MRTGRTQLLTPNESFDALFNVHARSLAGTAAIFRANILTPGDNGLNENFVRDEVYYDSAFNNPQNYDPGCKRQRTSAWWWRGFTQSRLRDR